MEDYYCLGIDLGTTKSSVGICINGKIEIIPDKETRNKFIPSVVSFTENDILIGESAKNNIEKNYKNTIYNIMILIGKKFDDPEIQKEIKLLPYKVIKGENNKLKIEVEYKKKIKTFFPEEILAFILSKLKRNVKEYLGKEINDTVISCPNYFNYIQKEAIRLACTIAGLNLIRNINGTNAFAISYYYNNIIQEEKNVLIFHLGAGFFDVGIMTIDNSLSILIEVKSICGDSYLGGEYFDNRLLEYCINKFKEENGIDISNNKKALLRLKLSCEKAKINLSKMEITTIALDDLINEEDFYITITRSEFEGLCKKDFDKLIPIIEECLNNINFTKYNIDDIFLIGESTHIPKIKQIVKDYFEKDVNKTYSLESETIGATIQSAISNNLDENFLHIVLLEVIPFSLGIELDNGEMDVIISKNTTVPCECIKSYEFEIKNKNKIIIKAYEGEKRLAKENIFLGIIEIANIVPNQGKKIRIDVKFLLDINGSLILQFYDSNGGQINNLKIKMDYEMDEDIIDKLIYKAKEIEEDDKRYVEKMKIKNELLSIVMILINNKNKNIKKQAEETLIWIKSNPDASKKEYENKLTLIKTNK